MGCRKIHGWILRSTISSNEFIWRVLLKRNSFKAPGYNEKTAEHIKFAGLKPFLIIVYNNKVSKEYVPIIFRWGIHVHLLKGKILVSTTPTHF